MNYYNASGQMDLSDRIAIETGICIGESFKKIAKRLRRHPSTIAHEVKENRTFIKGNYPNGKDCSKVRHCTVKNLIYAGVMKKPVIQSVDFAEEWIVPRCVIDMYQLLAISLIRLRMFVITVRIKSFVTKISIFTVRNSLMQL